MSCLLNRQRRSGSDPPFVQVPSRIRLISSPKPAPATSGPVESPECVLGASPCRRRARAISGVVLASHHLNAITPRAEDTATSPPALEVPALEASTRLMQSHRVEETHPKPLVRRPAANVAATMAAFRSRRAGAPSSGSRVTEGRARTISIPPLPILATRACFGVVRRTPPKRGDGQRHGATNFCVRRGREAATRASSG